jgi:hypothetical protein
MQTRRLKRLRLEIVDSVDLPRLGIVLTEVLSIDLITSRETRWFFSLYWANAWLEQPRADFFSRLTIRNLQSTSSSGLYSIV